MKYLKEYELWCGNPYFDKGTKERLQSLAKNGKEIEDCFYKNLEFGTGGMRGVMGDGTNRMNRYSIRRATTGLANYIKKVGKEQQGVVIAYDSRNQSEEFAKETAYCLCANEIPVYLFSKLRPTPMLSYAVRALGCAAGVCITASHNPAQYNGYKVYGDDGGQIAYPQDQQVIAEVEAITDYTTLQTLSKEVAEKSEYYHILPESFDEGYYEALTKLVLNTKVLKEAGNLQIVYTPLHGAGNIPVRHVLDMLGFDNVHTVLEQEQPDGDFPTVVSPNPEDIGAYELAIQEAEKVNADVIFATDPDSDRVGMCAWDKRTHSYRAFDGNMSAALLLEYRLATLKKEGLLPQDGAVVTTIVSGNMPKKIAKAYGVQVYETLTGFKYIGQKISEFEKHNKSFLLGYEESYGCLLGTYARDKDAVVAVMSLSEAAAYYKGQGSTLSEQMDYLYEKYGYYQEDLMTVTLQGKEGSVQIEAIMKKLRANLPQRLQGRKVLKASDYLRGIEENYETNEVTELALPESNVLHFGLEGDGWCCVRPSGTEPKIKFYAGVCEETGEEAKKQVGLLLKDIARICQI